MKCDVLIVDDEKQIRYAFGRILETRGVEVRGASTAFEALDQLEKHEPPSLILLDLMMPELDGWAFRKRQLHHGLAPDVPIVVVSAVDSGLDAKSRGLGAREALAKPVEPQRLLETVGKYLEVPA